MIVIKGSEIGGQIGEKIKTTSSNAYEHVKSSITTNVIQPSQKVLNENFVEPSKKIYVNILFYERNLNLYRL